MIPPLATRERIIELHESGVPSSVVARRLHVPRREVNHVIKEHIGKQSRKEKQDAKVRA